ncbi:MAG: UDP-N-acetylenolpyruvoylglucosamine reductase [uncultured bacterium]|nr:MAG: UDP-N-acetylenolpyruvoylglucosamine reductase [uncultured bacterium]
MNSIIEQLNASGASVLAGEMMNKHTNFRIGGPADYYARVTNVEQLKALIAKANELGIKYTVLGGGSNVLVSDSGVRGLVIQIAMRDVKVEGNRLIAGAGAPNTAVSRQASSAGLSGLEWAVTVPGTVGGMVYGNAGCYGSETKDFVESVTALCDGEIKELKKDELDFSYRHSIFKEHKDWVIFQVSFLLSHGDKKEIEEKINALLAKRMASQPFDSSSAGCMFKNFEFSNEKDIARLKEKFIVPEEFISKKNIPAGWLIENLGLKGETIGSAQISQKHGNFIVNLGNATAFDVFWLVEKVKDRAKDEFGILLQNEVQYIGF